MEPRTMSRFCLFTKLGSALMALIFSASAAWAADKPAAGGNATTTKPAAPAATEKTPVQLAADAFESALKQNNLFYQRTDPPGQAIAFTIGMQDSTNRSSIQHFSVYDSGYQTADSKPMILIHGWAEAIGQKNLPASVGQAIAELNDTRNLATGSMNEYGAFGTLGFFADAGIQPYTYYIYCWDLHWTTLALTDKLTPLLKAASTEK